MGDSYPNRCLTFWKPLWYFYVGQCRPGGHLNTMMSSYQYRHSDDKDKTVSPTVLSLTWKSPYLGKTVYLLRRGPVLHCAWRRSRVNSSSLNKIDEKLQTNLVSAISSNSNNPLFKQRWPNLPLHFPDSKVHGANMGPTWVLSAQDGPHVGPVNLAIWVIMLGGGAGVVMSHNYVVIAEAGIRMGNCQLNYCVTY